MSYSKAVIQLSEKPLWDSKKYLYPKTLPKSNLPDGLTVFTKIEHCIDQTKSFEDFSKPNIIKKTGYNATQMKANSCGISSLYMAIKSLDSELFTQQFPTLEQFAIATLSFHRNDLKKGSKILKTGTPVFNLKSGWFHNAMIFVTEEFSTLKGYRFHNLTNESQHKKLFSYAASKQKSIVIASVHINKWTNASEATRTHLLLINGVKVKNNKITSIIVSDPYPFNNSIRCNTPVKYHDSYFSGRFIVLHNDKT